MRQEKNYTQTYSYLLPTLACCICNELPSEDWKLSHNDYPHGFWTFPKGELCFSCLTSWSRFFSKNSELYYQTDDTNLIAAKWIAEIFLTKKPLRLEYKILEREFNYHLELEKIKNQTHKIEMENEIYDLNGWNFSNLFLIKRNRINSPINKSAINYLKHTYYSEAAWIHDRCIKNPNHTTKKLFLFRDYKKWISQTCFSPSNAVKFYQSLSSKPDVEIINWEDISGLELKE